MTDGDFEKLQALMASRAGFRLTRDRAQLARHRLGPVARREGFDSVDAMLASLWEKPVASLGWAVIEALLNAETWFRRDRKPFDVFAHELLPAVSRARGAAPVTVWSAGCSTGQEAYSVAMAALDAAIPVDIVGTDLSARGIERAKLGAYTGFEIQRGLSARTMLRWFEPLEDHWVAKPDLKAAVRFYRANLLDEAEGAGRFDIIFCRHVLKDMDPTRRGRVVEALERRLVDDGCLVLGPDERLEADTVAFSPVGGREGLYVKAPAAIRRAA